MNRIESVKLMTIEDGERMNEKESLQLFRKHINPNYGKMLSMLGFAQNTPVKAEGMYITLQDNRKILDLTGQFGIMCVGHNHPRILEVRRKWAAEKNLELWKFFPSPYQGVLCHNLAQIFPEDLEMVFFCNSGAEANEGAMKLAEKYAGMERPKIVHTDISFHGKTHATLSVSGSEKHQSQYFRKIDHCIMVKYGDIADFERVIQENMLPNGVCKIGTFIVEAVRTEGVVVPDSRYFQRVRELCDQHDIVLIMDEVYTGFGRTGKMFAFEHHGICPDVCSFSKAFGAGKASFAAFITRPRIYNKAYSRMNEANLHSTTYNGFGEEVITAIEMLHIIQDEKLVSNSEQMGQYLKVRLEELQREFPKMITDVRVIGLLACIKFENRVEKLLGKVSGAGVDLVERFMTGAVMTLLFQKYNILAFTPPHDFSQLMLTPSLIINEAQIDYFITSLKAVLKENLWLVGFDYIKRLSAG